MRVNADRLEAAFVKNSMEKHKVLGAAIALIRQRELRSRTYFGIADPETGRMVEEGTHFEAASLTKTVFAWYILRLEKEGGIDLDRPLYEYSKEDLPTEDPAFRLVTARQILCHASGLPDWGKIPMPLAFAPGQGFRYSGQGYTYLQNVIERLMGERLDVLLQRDVFSPLGMKDAALIWTAPLNHSLSRTFDERGNIELPRSSCRHSVGCEPNAAFSMYVTLNDYVKFLLQLLGESDTMEHIRKTKNPAAPGIFWGLGWGQCRETLWHWGDNGGFKAFVILDPETGDAVLIFTNSASGLEVCYDCVRKITGSDMDDIRRMIENAEPE